MTKRLLVTVVSLVICISAAGYTLVASAAPKQDTAAPTLQSLDVRIGVLETEVTALRRSEFQNQITTLNKAQNTLYDRVNLLCSESAAACPS